MNERDRKVWEQFILLLSVDAFGEEEVIGAGKVQKNLFGSVEYHRAMFERAVKQVDVWDKLEAP